MDAQHQQLSTRWTPTPEQLQILKDLYYNQGVRNPSAEEIERISQRLSQFGRIEEKNVFYWFQNRKSREKQQAKRLATTTAIATTPQDLQQQQAAGGSGGSGGYAAKRSKLETLPLFPMHSNSACNTKQDADGSQPSLELSLRPYSSTP